MSQYPYNSGFNNPPPQQDFSYFGAQQTYAAYHPGPPVPAVVPGPVPLSPANCFLQIRQQPKEALLTVKGKEKFRKPVDPPPIVYISVQPEADPQGQYLQNPYIFVCASLYKPDKDEPIDGNVSKSMSGTLVSSLHRLKDMSNKDGGFFVFGDISVKQQGMFRLHFTLYEFRPHMGECGEYLYLADITSDRFSVVLPKDFKGLQESTYLSRAFSDQGVRLRIRKESRGKRPIEEEEEAPMPAPKRQRMDGYIDMNPYYHPHMPSWGI